MAAAGGVLGVAVVGSLWRARQGRFVITYGSSRWATGREVAKAGLFDAKGVLTLPLHRIPQVADGC